MQLKINHALESIKKRRGHKKAIIAISRFLLISVYFVLLNKTEFDYKRFDELLNKNIKKHNRSIKNKDDMISYLSKLGYTVTLENT